jgi:DNA-binding NarL/FixJ family response regulator
MTSIALVENHPALRHSLKQLIGSRKEFMVVHEAANSDDLIDIIQHKKFIPDVVIIDSRMQLNDGMPATMHLQKEYPEISIITLRICYHEKKIPRNEPQVSASQLFHNEEYELISKTISDALLSHEENSNRPQPGRRKPFTINISMSMSGILTEKQKNFLRLSATDLTYKEIAERMKITPKTADRYRDELFRKLNIKSRVGLALFAIRIGLIE